MTIATIARLSHQTGFSIYQIEQYLLRCAADEIPDAILEANIREAGLFEIELDYLGG